MLNGQLSTWFNIEVGVLQRFILGPLFFIGISDILGRLTSHRNMFDKVNVSFGLLYITQNNLPSALLERALKWFIRLGVIKYLF